MASGTVKWFNATKGYGFIQPDDGSPDVFVHISAVERSGLSGLNDGQKLTYDLVSDRRTGKSAAANPRTFYLRRIDYEGSTRAFHGLQDLCRGSIGVDENDKGGGRGAGASPRALYR